MIRFFNLLAGIILALSVTAAHGAETIACDYMEKFKGGGSRGVWLSLTVEGGEVTGIDYMNTINTVAPGKGGYGYRCSFEAKASDGQSVWTRKKNLAVVELAESEGIRKSTFEIRKSPKGYTVSFADMSSQYCGFGAEFPVSVRIEKGKKSCRVKTN
jgi:hypothetical protein